MLPYIWKTQNRTSNTAHKARKNYHFYWVGLHCVQKLQQRKSTEDPDQKPWSLRKHAKNCRLALQAQAQSKVC